MQIVAVSRSPVHGFSKAPVSSIHLIAGEGIEGDAHRGTTTQHLYRKRKNPSLPNLAQVHLLAREHLEELAAKGITVNPGELGENILTAGIVLLALPRGARFHLGPEAIIEISGLRTPCSQIDDFQSGLQQHMWGLRGDDGKPTRRAGVMAIVIEGGDVSVGDTITLEMPAEPYISLGPV